MLIERIDAWELKRRFENFDRDYYSLESCEIMVELFNELEGDTKLDVIGLCGDFTEFESASDWYRDSKGRTAFEVLKDGVFQEFIDDNEGEKPSEDELDELIEERCQDELERDGRTYWKLKNGCFLTMGY